MNEQTNFVIELIRKYQTKSVLNVGYRHDSDDTVENFCRLHKINFDIIEIYSENCMNIRKERNLFCYEWDITNIKNLQCPNYDIILWLHGPEHISWDAFLDCRSDIENKANYAVLYQAPIGMYEQGALYGNPYETHVSTLYPEMFENIGYDVFLHNKNGEFTFSAIKKKL